MARALWKSGVDRERTNSIGCRLTTKIGARWIEMTKGRRACPHLPMMGRRNVFIAVLLSEGQEALV